VKRVFISLALALTLVAVMAVPAMAANSNTESTPASVTVKHFISIGLIDTPAGIHFGDVDRGSTDNADQDQDNDTPSIQVVVAEETNVIVDLKSACIPFIPVAWPADDIKYSLTYDGAKRGMSPCPAFTTFAESVNDDGSGNPVEEAVSTSLWHWLNVPSYIPGGTYHATLYYKAVTH
jgi:hypothetical protein